MCKLKIALYGLKQSPRAWFGRFFEVMRKKGYLQLNGEHTLFYKHSKIGKVTMLVVYVDDIIITGSDNEERVRLEKECMSEFTMKNLGQMKFFLGI